MWQKLDRFLGQKCCLFCGRSGVESTSSVQVELASPGHHKAQQNGIVPTANGRLPNGLAQAPRDPPPNGLVPSGGRAQDSFVQLSGGFPQVRAVPSLAGRAPSGAGQAGGGFPQRAAAQPAYLSSSQQHGAAPAAGWSGPGPPRPDWAKQPAGRGGAASARGPPVSLRHPYQPSPSHQRRQRGPSTAAGPAGSSLPQTGPGPAPADGSDWQAGPGPGRGPAARPRGPQAPRGPLVPPPAYSLPRQPRPNDEAPAAAPAAGTLPVEGRPRGQGQDRSRSGEPAPPSSVLPQQTAPEAGFISDLKAGDLLGRSNEELVLLLIQLRRQSAATVAAQQRVRQQLERTAAESGSTGQQTEPPNQQTERLKAQLARLEKQHQLTRPLITLVDNMLKLSSLRGSRPERDGGAADGDRPGAAPPGGPPPGQDRSTGPEEPVRDSERLLQRQRALQDELSRVKAVLSSSAKSLDETAADNSRLEREMLSLRQRLQTALKATNHNEPTYNQEVRALEAEVRRVQGLLSARESGRRPAEDSRESGRRSPEESRRPAGEPAPLHRSPQYRRAGPASGGAPDGRSPDLTGEYSGQTLLSSGMDHQTPPPPAPGDHPELHGPADRRRRLSGSGRWDGAGRGQPASDADPARPDWRGGRRGLPKSVSGPLSGAYDPPGEPPYDPLYDSLYARPSDPPPYVPPAPPTAEAGHWRWPGRHGGYAQWPPGGHADRQRAEAAARRAEQQAGRRRAGSQQDLRSALAASYQAYRRASGALPDGDCQGRLQAALRHYRSSQELGSGLDDAGALVGLRQPREQPRGFTQPQEHGPGFNQPQERGPGFTRPQEQARGFFNQHEHGRGFRDQREHGRSFRNEQEQKRGLISQQEQERGFGRQQEQVRDFTSRQEQGRGFSNQPEQERGFTNEQKQGRGFANDQERGRGSTSREGQRISFPPQEQGRGFANQQEQRENSTEHQESGCGPNHPQKPQQGPIQPQEAETSFSQPQKRETYYNEPRKSQQNFSQPQELRRSVPQVQEPVRGVVVAQPSPLRVSAGPTHQTQTGPSHTDRGAVLPQLRPGAFQRYLADVRPEPAADGCRQSHSPGDGADRRVSPAPCEPGQPEHGRPSEAVTEAALGSPRDASGKVEPSEERREGLLAAAQATGGSGEPESGPAAAALRPAEEPEPEPVRSPHRPPEPSPDLTSGQAPRAAAGRPRSEAAETGPASVDQERDSPDGSGLLTSVGADSGGRDVRAGAGDGVGSRAEAEAARCHGDSGCGDSVSAEAGTWRAEPAEGEKTTREMQNKPSPKETVGPLFALLSKDRASMEIRTVRVVKRESQQRQKEKHFRTGDDKQSSSLGDDRNDRNDSGDDESADERENKDPLLPQLARAMSLPRGYGRRASQQDELSENPHYRHHMLKRLVDKHGSSSEDLNLARPPMRSASSTPDIVRASRPGPGLRYDEDTIDRLLARPQKIHIPERYVPELELEPMSAEERLQRSRKAASIRKMLTQSTGFLDSICSAEPRSARSTAATDKLQRAHILQLNEILARQVTEQSKRVAAAASCD